MSVSRSLLIVTLVHQHVPGTVTELFSLHTELLSATLPHFVLPASECLGPVLNFCSQYQLMVSGSKLSLLQIGGDFPGFAQLNSRFSFILIFCSHRQIISANLESPREWHIGKLNSCLGFLMFPCIPVLTTNLPSILGFIVFSRNFAVWYFWCPPL